MNVRGPLVDGILQQVVDKTHRGLVFSQRLHLLQRQYRLGAVILRQGFHRDRAVVLVDGAFHRLWIGIHRFHRLAGEEAEHAQQLVLGRIGTGDNQELAVLHQRHHLKLPDLWRAA